ncbi:hypothetical protein RN001_006615 [Aquatica leii]|uniref:Arginine/serine-rich protein PNISR n=1 Tax=Aquatica leii TaxID=1421715 RepID=A0AAN7PLB2_9COLE|nr:hypothetical protein RN001_006615 [Aquatica leii]
MYSGSDSTGPHNYNPWPLNPAAYQNTPNDQIDWAALAQQWIIMKEAGPPVPEQLTAPPPPKIQKLKKDNSFEGGEAPMEVENEREEDIQPPNWNENNSNEPGWNWNQQQNWGWNNTWPTPSAVPPPAPSTPKAPLLPTPPTYNQYTTSNENSNNYAGTTNEYSGGYWTSNANKIKPHNKRYSKVNVSARSTVPPAPTIDPVMLDATKRKQLPAWIREGLEKMERDKQKQIEREREQQEKQEVSEKSVLDEKEALEIIKSTVKERERSKFESDGEDSPTESNNRDSEQLSPESVVLSHEELMLKVRRTMTEILLKVTNQEIRAVCKEEFQRILRKHKASDQRVSAPSGTNISGRLGLGMYGDSGSSSEDSDNDSDTAKTNSDTELKDTIKRRKAEFSKTEREIEARLAAAEKINTDSRGGTPKADSCDSQVDAKSQGHKIKNKESNSPKLITKRHKSHRDSTSSSEDSDSSEVDAKERKNIRPKKSSSSESDRSQKFVKVKRRRSRESKSASPERKKAKEKTRRNSEQKLKHSESSSSKSSSIRSRKSRSKSLEMKRRNSHSTERSRRILIHIDQGRTLDLADQRLEAVDLALIINLVNRDDRDPGLDRNAVSGRDLTRVVKDLDEVVRIHDQKLEVAESSPEQNLNLTVQILVSIDTLKCFYITGRISDSRYTSFSSYGAYICGINLNLMLSSWFCNF